MKEYLTTKLENLIARRDEAIFNRWILTEKKLDQEIRETKLQLMAID